MLAAAPLNAETVFFSTEEEFVITYDFGVLHLLSARDGMVVAYNRDLLNSAIPAGIPDRGVDYGLDAVIAPRTGEVIRI
jgi:hypothetical protein